MFPEITYFVCVRRSVDSWNEFFDFDTASSINKQASLAYASWKENSNTLPPDYFRSNPIIRVDQIVIHVL